MKKAISSGLLLAVLLSFSSCAMTHLTGGLETGDKPEAPSTAALTVDDTAEASEADTEAPEAGGIIRGITPVAYPDPYRISEYEVLTDDQKLIFDVFAEALGDILENGPEAGKVYPLPKRVDFKDYQLIGSLFQQNFAVLNSFIISLYDNGAGTLDYVDSIQLLGGDIIGSEVYEESYSEWLTLDAKADEILAAIEHDGTEYGMARAIAQYLVDNVVYPPDYRERPVTDRLESVYSTLIRGEAVCQGYAESYDLLCKKAGLETIEVGGLGHDQPHAWNMIRIGGTWYHIDVTWMDDDGAGTTAFLTYFMMPDDICYPTGHSDASYYWDAPNDTSVMPVADSYEYWYLEE